MSDTGSDYYKVLGVTCGASRDDIRAAYWALAKRYHPDLNPGDRSAEEHLKKVIEAYDVLGNPDRRHDYDNMRYSVNAGRDTHSYPFEQKTPRYDAERGSFYRGTPGVSRRTYSYGYRYTRRTGAWHIGPFGWTLFVVILILFGSLIGGHDAGTIIRYTDDPEEAARIAVADLSVEVMFDKTYPDVIGRDGGWALTLYSNGAADMSRIREETGADVYLGSFHWKLKGSFDRGEIELMPTFTSDSFFVTVEDGSITGGRWSEPSNTE